MREFPANRGRDLGYVAGRGQPVEPGQQRLLERGRDRHGRQRSRERVVVALIPEQIGLQHGPGQLLDEQGHAVGLGDDLVEHRRQVAPCRRSAAPTMAAPCRRLNRLRVSAVTWA